MYNLNCSFSFGFSVTPPDNPTRAGRFFNGFWPPLYVLFFNKSIYDYFFFILYFNKIKPIFKIRNIDCGNQFIY